MATEESERQPRIGLALGGGSARGWAHVGVIRALLEMGIVPEVIAGTSAGALVGAAYVCGRLDEFERWIGGLVWTDAASYLDLGLVGGLVKGKKLFKFFAKHLDDRPIETLPMPFGAVATDLTTGAEVWMTEGSLFDAVRASISVPGLLRPVLHEGRWCVDGGLVDPVPIKLCRTLGADLVIAVDVNAGILDWPMAKSPAATEAADRDPEEPSLYEVVERSLRIVQERLARSRMKEDPPDVLLQPKVAEIGFIEFHRAGDSFAAGRQAVAEAAAELREKILGLAAIRDIISTGS
jgi:NTE family protein